MVEQSVAAPTRRSRMREMPTLTAIRRAGGRRGWSLEDRITVLAQFIQNLVDTGRLQADELESYLADLVGFGNELERMRKGEG